MGMSPILRLPAKASIGHPGGCRSRRRSLQECLKLVIGIFTLFLVLDRFAIIGNIILTW